VTLITHPASRARLGGVHHNIVEGEPGIFPDPVTRILRIPGRWLDRRKGRNRAGQPDQPDAPPARDEAGPEAAAPEPSGDDQPST